MLVAARAWRGLCVWQLFGKLVAESERSPDGRSGPWMLLGVLSLALRNGVQTASLPYGGRRRRRPLVGWRSYGLVRSPISRHTMTALIVAYSLNPDRRRMAVHSPP